MPGLMSAVQPGIKEIAGWTSINSNIYVSLFKTKPLTFYYFGTNQFSSDYIRFDGSKFYAIKDGKYSVSSGGTVRIINLKAGEIIASGLSGGNNIVYICKL